MHYKSFQIFHCFLPKRISQLCGWCGTGSTSSLVKQTDCDTLLFRHLSSLAERTGHYTGLFLWYHWKTMYFYWDIKLCHYLRIAKFCYPKKITQISWDHEKKHSIYQGTGNSSFVQIIWCKNEDRRASATQLFTVFIKWVEQEQCYITVRFTLQSSYTDLLPYFVRARILELELISSPIPCPCALCFVCATGWWPSCIIFCCWSTKIAILEQQCDVWGSGCCVHCAGGYHCMPLLPFREL